jgi:predicted O-linked N-acetylglucosamine transferase (SPINDLY family)
LATAEQTVSLAMDLVRQGRVREGVAQLRRLVQRQPNNWMASAALGQALMQAGELEQALFQFQRCAQAQPANPASHNNLGMILEQMRRGDEALSALREAVRIDPAYATGWLGLSMALLRVRDYAAAEDAARRVVALRPESADAYQNLGLILMDSGRVEAGIETLRHGLAIAPGNAAMRSTLLIGLNYRSSLSAVQLRAEHEEFGLLHPPIVGSHPARTDPTPDRKLRVGVLSSDFREQSVMYFFEPVLEHRDAAQVEYVLFSTSGTTDATTARLRRQAAWVNAAMPDDAVIDGLIRAQKIDILLDLGGHSGANRMTVLRNKPAPVIATAIGYPNTTGMPHVDWRIVDSLTDPAGSESHATEKLIRLDPCFLCYRPPESAPEVATRATGDGSSAASPPITFGSFNALPKLSPETIQTWAVILARMPRSCLVLKATALQGTAARDLLLERLADAGISSDRVELLPPTTTTADHLALYSKIDIALDPFPYNGTTTTCEALWMGVPVATLKGDRHASRVGLSLLTAAGLPELIAHTRDDYVALAAALANDRNRLSDYRQQLRPKLAASALCNAPAYARRFESALRSMWRRYCQNSR